MPKGQLKKCECGGKLKHTFETLDLIEYQCEQCETVYTLYHVVKKWPKTITITTSTDLEKMLVSGQDD